MRLYEFDRQGDSSTVTRIVALTNQIKKDLDRGELPDEFSTDDLINYFRKYNIILDRTDLYNMVKVPPLKDVITNIQGDKVVFKGKSEGDTPKDETQKVVAQMAAKAQK